MAPTQETNEKDNTQKHTDSKPKNDEVASKSEGGKPSKEECRQEASKAAKRALELQNQARELNKAAADAKDADERQRLLDEALSKSKEAESLAKTAKFLQSGGFQGLLAGGGVGTIVGVGLGTLVGTLTGALVGGVGTLVVGGLGSGIGSAVGALHGPWLKSEEALRNSFGKIAGALPNWTATPEQKDQLEKIIGQIDKQQPPTDEELAAMTGDDG